MTDIDEVEVTMELVNATGEAAARIYPDWTHAVSANIQTSRGVSTITIVAYRGDEGSLVGSFANRDISTRVSLLTDKLFVAQGSEWAGMKCTVARTGAFRIEYSYNDEESIKWANKVFSGLTPDELVENLRPQDQ